HSAVGPRRTHHHTGKGATQLFSCALRPDAHRPQTGVLALRATPVQLRSSAPGAAGTAAATFQRERTVAVGATRGCAAVRTGHHRQVAGTRHLDKYRSALQGSTEHPDRHT